MCAGRNGHLPARPGPEARFGVSGLLGQGVAEASFETLPLWGTWLAFAAALTLIIRGGNWFVEGAVWLARITRVPRVLVGATVVSAATTLPEVAVSTTSALSGHPGIAFGNAVGSVIANIGLILALLIVVSPARDEGSLRARLRLMLLAGAAAALVSYDGSIGRVEGLALLALFAFYLWESTRSALLARRQADNGAGAHLAAAAAEPGTGNGDIPPEGQQGAQGGDSPARRALEFCAGAVLVVLGSRLLVAAGSTLAKAAGVSETVIGLTLVAVGTSLPELATAIISAIKRASEISVGNIVGANLLNSTVVLGGAATLHPIRLAASEASVNLAAMLAAMGLLALLYFGSGRLLRWHGALLLAAYGFYVWSIVTPGGP